MARGKQRPTEQDLLQLVGLVYEASLAQSVWPIFLEKFAEVVSGTVTSLIHYDPADFSTSFALAVRIDPAVIQKYNEHYISMDAWGQAAKRTGLPQGKVFCGEEICPNEVLTRSEFYNDFLTTIDCFHQFGGVILKNGDIYSMISSLRSKQSGAFGENEAWLLGNLIPHLQRAFQVHRRIVGLETQSQAAADALDRLPIGLVLVNAQGKALVVNRAAREILAGCDGLALTREGLVAVQPSETASLRKMIHGAAQTAAGKGLDSGGVLAVSRPSLKRPLAVLVTPLASNCFELGSDRPAAAVFVSDPEKEHQADHEMLARLFGLTPAEAKLAGLMMRGKSLEGAAAGLGVTLNTARTHLKRIFTKTGTARQSELMRMLLTSPAMLRTRK